MPVVDSTTDEIRQNNFHWYKNYIDSKSDSEEQEDLVEDLASEKERREIRNSILILTKREINIQEADTSIKIVKPLVIQVQESSTEDEV